MNSEHVISESPHEHARVPIFGEGVDLEELVPIGFACAGCRKELTSLVPRKNPQFAVPLKRVA